MKIVHIKITFEDRFSGAKTEKTCTRSEDTFRKMQSGIGSTVKEFSNGINYLWEVKKVEQA